MVLPQRLQRYIVTSFPDLESNCFSWLISHLWNPLLHRVLPLCLSLGRGFLNGSMSAMVHYTQRFAFQMRHNVAARYAYTLTAAACSYYKT